MLNKEDIPQLEEMVCLIRPLVENPQRSMTAYDLRLIADMPSYKAVRYLNALAALGYMTKKGGWAKWILKPILFYFITDKGIERFGPEVKALAEVKGEEQ